MTTERFIEALRFSCQLHAGQKRKGTEKPYAAHLLGVASIVFEYGGGEAEAIAGLLHDAIEDQGGDATRRKILSIFGEDITAMVNGCTDSDVTPKPPWKERKLAYLEHLAVASESTQLVAASDKLYNARAIVADYREVGEDLWNRFNTKRDDTLWYYRSLVQVFKGSDRAPKPLIDELDRVVSDMEGLVAERLGDKQKKGAQCHLLLHDKYTAGELNHAKTFDLVRTFADESHLERYACKCKDCGQLYFYEWYEEVDWDEGDDSTYCTLIPVATLDEALKMADMSSFELLQFFPRLQMDSTSTDKGGTWRWLGRTTR